MLSKVKWLLPIALLFLVSSGTAGIRPSFSLDYSAWEATNIVIASEGEVIDGKFLVLESLKGDALAGETIEIPDLAKFESKQSRLVKLPFGSKPEGPPQYVSGQRMILFLKRKNPKPKTDDPQKEATSPVWRAANLFDEMNASVVWLEGDKSFAFHQFMNPGPSELVENGKSEAELRIRTLEVMQIRASFDSAASINDRSRRAEALAFFTNSEIQFVRLKAFEELKNGGRDSRSALSQLLLDQSRSDVHPQVIEVLGEIGGEDLGLLLTEIVRTEMRFWKQNAPRLKEGWWNDFNGSETEGLRNRYSKALEALRALKKLKYHRSREVVSELRDVWRSFPQLEDKTGLDQLSKSCDELLAALESQGR